ncbi:MAG: dephospho-CoA kinase [Lachnospiraceae bacterium]|nr:dephospho-CoA kinase [Lachnospiraceae bacterium]
MKIIGLTGGAGCGKSYVAKVIMKNFPILHISTDDISRRQMEPGGAVYDAVVREFGNGIVQSDRTIDRSKLATIVFSDQKKLSMLNGITHPAVFEELRRIFKIVEDGLVLSPIFDRPIPYEAVLVETAILKEAGYCDMCDAIWYVYAPEEQRIGRMMRDRGYTRERCVKTLTSQATDEEYRSYATGVIENPDKTRECDIIRQVRELIYEMKHSK